MNELRELLNVLGLYVRFAGRLDINTPEAVALTQAQQEYTAPPPGKRLVYWTDGARSHGEGNRTAASVVHKRHHDSNPSNLAWDTRAYRFEKSADIWIAELYAISQALSNAHEYLKEQSGPYSDEQKTVVIYSDSKEALNMIKVFNQTTQQSRTLGRTAHELAWDLVHRLNCGLELLWVLAHKGVQGNEVTDAVAKEANKQALDYYEKSGEPTVLPGVLRVNLKGKIVRERNTSKPYNMSDYEGLEPYWKTTWRPTPLELEAEQLAPAPASGSIPGLDLP